MSNGLPENYLRPAGKPYVGKNKPARKKIRQVSKKKREELKIYAKLRKQLLAERPICEICSANQSTDCHHKKRRGRFYLDYSTYAALCRNCHMYLHENPSWARENGWLM
jgi:hypothetical protein